MMLALSLLIKQNDSDCVRHVWVQFRVCVCVCVVCIQTNFRENIRIGFWMDMNREIEYDDNKNCNITGGKQLNLVLSQGFSMFTDFEASGNCNNS